MKERVNGDKGYLDRTCYEVAKERADYLFDAFDDVFVAFSGGKDSTAVLNVVAEVARDRRKLPVDVVFWDEEAIAPETEDYVRRVSQRDDVRLHWLCTPNEQRNACSRTVQHWYPWLEEDRAKWVRDLPPEAIRDVPGTHKLPIPESAPLVLDWLRSKRHAKGSVAWCLGIRAQESLTRTRIITAARGDYAWIKHADGVSKCLPVYDWTADDVWLAPHLLGWDYNRTYEVQAKAGLSIHEQRISPPFGEQPIRNLWMWSVCWPHLWDRMIERVPGAATCARYSNTSLYAIGGVNVGSAAGYRDKVLAGIARLPAEAQAEVGDVIRTCVSHHYKYSDDPLPEDAPHPVSGYCWRDLAVVVNVGNNKLGRQLQKVQAKARDARVKAGIMTAAEDTVGSPAYRH